MSEFEDVVGSEFEAKTAALLERKEKYIGSMHEQFPQFSRFQISNYVGKYGPIEYRLKECASTY